MSGQIIDGCSAFEFSRERTL